MGDKKTLILGGVLILAFLAGVVWVGTKIPGNDKGSGQPQVAGARVEVSTSPDDPVRGNPQAPVTIVEFSDFQCPFCARVEPTLKQILKDYQDQVRLFYKDFPLPIHQNAQNAALAALCAKEQEKFWEYHDKLFENQEKLGVLDLKRYAQELGLATTQFNSCFESKKYQAQIDQDIKDGQAAGVQGTPAFFINGRLISGAQPFENFKAIIEEELKK